MSHSSGPNFEINLQDVESRQTEVALKKQADLMLFHFEQLYQADQLSAPQLIIRLHVKSYDWTNGGSRVFVCLCGRRWFRFLKKHTKTKMEDKGAASAELNSFMAACL